MPVRPHRPARRAAALMAAASTLVVGALGGAQAATAQELGTGAGSSVVRPQATWPVDQPPPSDVTPAPPSTPTTTPTMPMDRASPTALRPASWNAFIAYGATTELGFQGTGSPTLGTATCVAWPN